MKSPINIAKDRNRIITDIHTRYTPLLVSIAGKYYGKDVDARKDVIQDFFHQRFCGKQPMELEGIREKGAPFIKVMFKNFIIDQLRKEQRAQKKRESIIEVFMGRDNYIIHSDFDEIALIKKCEKIIIDVCKAKSPHIRVFKMMLKELGNKEIAQGLGTSVNNVRVIKHRLRTILKDRIITTI